ncbi:phosphotransferase [Actinopolymorpha singaporensis]
MPMRPTDKDVEEAVRRVEPVADEPDPGPGLPELTRPVSDGHVDRGVPVRRGAIAEWLLPRHPDLSAVEVGARRALAGGVASALVEHVDVTAVGADGRRYRYGVVAKRASAAEVATLSEIAAIPGTDAFPELIDAGTDQSGAWLVTPYYPGSPMPWDAAVPDNVLTSLARMHHHYLGRTNALPPDLPRVDEAFCRGALLDFSPSWIHAAQRAEPHPVHDRALDLLRRWSDDERIHTGLRLLPATLLHGDVYGFNVVVADDGTAPPRLIDWGSARVGPIMLDVVMYGDWPSAAGLSAYLRAWEHVTGSPLDPWQAEAGYAWATAFSNATFVGPVARRFGPTQAQTMLDHGEAALERFAQLLTNPRS